MAEFIGTVTKKGCTDVFVAGGGVAGSAAALAAARCGKKVILAEKSLKLGGLATLGLINLFVPMCNGRGKQIQFGMAEEFLRLSIRYGYGDVPKEYVNGRIPEDVKRAYEAEGKKLPRYGAKFSAEIFALALTELLTEAGVTLLFDSQVAGVEADPGDPNRIKSVILLTASGFESYEAKEFIDTTGNADLLHFLGVPTVNGINYHTYCGQGISLESCRKALEKEDVSAALTSADGGTATLYGTRHPESVKVYDGTESSDVNRYLISNQLEMLSHYKDEENRKQRDIVTLPGMPQFREIRRIRGDYALKDEDRFRHFDDSIAAISDFSRRDLLFEIPYRALCMKAYPNVLTAGRTAAGDGFAWDVIRVIPPAILSGEAAGIAASHAIDEGKTVADVDIRALQKALEEANVLIHFDDADVPEEVRIEYENNDVH